MKYLFEEEVEVPFDFDYKEVAKQVIDMALDMEEFPFESEVDITLTDDAAIQEINKEFRQLDKSTDVLSFPLIEYKSAGDFSDLENQDDIFNPETGEAMLGDIVISVEHVLKQAEEYGHSIKREYAFLIAHSMLHLMGYDHMTPPEAKVMEEKQENILNALNITREE
ncbi:MAG: rRNA maturation RNase YbeY [Lachnospiraceae bacterium]|jgi:probable rRNA maturation factor|nr:rRNA maturation RNase YbeY [Lachnospiraceae bacterium]